MVVYFHRNLKAGFSINKVTQTVVSGIDDKKEYYVPEAGASPIAILKNLMFVRKHRDKTAINHITGDIHYCMLALRGCKSVLTIHDTGTVDRCPAPSLKRWIFKYFWFKLPIKLATKVVCISEETRKMVQRFTGRTDIEVIHNAVSPEFTKDENTAGNPSISTPFRVLHIGTAPNKNLKNTIRALQGLDCELTIIGNIPPEDKAVLEECGTNYVNKKNLTDEQIVEEYRRTDIVSFISLFEGFGMPVVEANTVGRPVICSDIPVLKSVAGSAALFVNPTDVAAMHDSFERLATDPGLRTALINAGFENVKRFSTEHIRASWLTLYSRI